MRAASRWKRLAPLSVLVTLPALAAPPHVHGTGSLEIALEARLLTVHLESPLPDLLGFERAPRGEAEAARVRQMAQQLRTPDGVITPASAAACHLVSVKLESAALAPALLGESAPARQAEAGGHADLDAQLVFNCDHPEAFRSFRVGLFRHFPGVRAINAAVVSVRGQRATTLLPRQAEMSW